jgi:hypothetical protein
LWVPTTLVVFLGRSTFELLQRDSISACFDAAGC